MYFECPNNLKNHKNKNKFENGKIELLDFRYFNIRDFEIAKKGGVQNLE